MLQGSDIRQSKAVLAHIGDSRYEGGDHNEFPGDPRRSNRTPSSERSEHKEKKDVGGNKGKIGILRFRQIRLLITEKIPDLLSFPGRVCSLKRNQNGIEAARKLIRR